MGRFPEHINCEQDLYWGRRYLSQLEHVNLNYRSYVERLLLWSWLVLGKSIIEIDYRNFQEFIKFHSSLPSEWLGRSPYPRFLNVEGEMLPNPKWRPLYLSPGQDHSKDYVIAQDTLIRVVSVCSGFYKFLISMNIASGNPAAASTQRKAPATQDTGPYVRALSSDQWKFVLSSAESMAEESQKNERALFIVATTFYLMLKTSDLAGLKKYPLMNMFFKKDGEWWLELPSSSGFAARVHVDPNYLPYLIRYRLSRRLSPLPDINDTAPLLVTHAGRPGMCKRQIQTEIKSVMARAYIEMLEAGKSEDESYPLLIASPERLRQSGAFHHSEKKSPLDLQRDYRARRLGYVYTRFYGDRAIDPASSGVQTSEAKQVVSSILDRAPACGDVPRTPTEYLIDDADQLSAALIYQRCMKGLALDDVRDMLAAFPGLPAEHILYRIVGAPLRLRKSRIGAKRSVRLSPQQSAVALQYARVLDKATSVFGTQSLATAWFIRPCRYLDGSVPMDLVDHTFGVQAVEVYLGRVLHGVYQ